MSIITCPTGLQVEVRPIRGKEGKLVADRRASKGTFLADSILAGCSIRTVDPGPYGFAPNGAPDWSKAVAGDRTYGLIRIRAATLGEEYEFGVQCENQGCSKKRYNWALRLDELPVKSMTPEARELFAQGNRFHTQLLDGRKVVYKIPTGYDQKKWGDILQADNDREVIGLAMRIVEIEGIHQNDIRTFLEDCDFADHVHLRNVFDEGDCGVETDIITECPSCGWQQEMILPFGKEFFMPKKISKTTNGH